MAEMQQTAIITLDHHDDVTIAELNGHTISIKQGSDTVIVHIDEFEDFLKLAGKWFKTSSQVAS